MKVSGAYIRHSLVGIVRQHVRTISGFISVLNMLNSIRKFYFVHLTTKTTAGATCKTPFNQLFHIILGNPVEYVYKILGIHFDAASQFKQGLVERKPQTVTLLGNILEIVY